MWEEWETVRICYKDDPTKYVLVRRIAYICVHNPDGTIRKMKINRRNDPIEMARCK